MFTIIKDLPEDTLGIMVSGKTTKEDYELLNPLLAAHKREHEKIKMLVEVRDFKYTAGALWQDLKFSFEYLGNISAIAVVTDKEWLDEGMEAFGKIWPHLKTKGFDGDQWQEAVEWLERQEI